MTKRILIILLIVSNHYAYSQQATLKVKDISELKNAFGEEIEVFKSLKFTINGKDFTATDSLNILFPINSKGFDTIKYSYTYKDKVYKAIAIAKFKENEIYSLWPCTCCGIFGISPKKPNRGVVRFKNNSNSKLIGITGELDYQILKPKSLTKYFLSSISMNCGFRPTELSIYSFNFKNESEDVWDKLEDKKYATDFLYMNGEKLTVEYLDNGRARLTFDGYLTNDEIKEFYKESSNRIND